MISKLENNADEAAMKYSKELIFHVLNNNYLTKPKQKTVVN